MKLRKRWIILGLLLFGANDALSSEYGTIIPSGDLHCSRDMFADTGLQSDKPKDIALVGTVTKIYPVAGLLKKWAVVVHIDRMVSGEFSDTTFTFTVHSPSRAGLRVGRAYAINAKWAEGGYVVDEFTLKEVRSRKKPSKKH